MRKVLVVYGTRPEAIKLAPVVAALSGSEHLRPVVVVTGQHRSMLDQVNSLFGIVPDHDLDLIRPRQELGQLTTRVIDGMTSVLCGEQPDAVLVQGDTTTCFAGALSAFYQHVPIVHLEAGLRTGDPTNPFPEEMNRRLTTVLSAIHLAPTSTSRRNLLREGVDPSKIFVTGNTVIDALLHVNSRPVSTVSDYASRTCGRRTILVTAHRRESWGEPMIHIARALARIALRFPDVVLMVPVHLNPAVREDLLPPLAQLSNVVITEPLAYGEFVREMSAATLVLTDSGGVQEEAPSLGKPVIVMRENTERPEAVVAGTVRLVGTSEDGIVEAVSRLLTDPAHYSAMSHAVNPYGDGKAAARARQAIEYFFGLANRPADFDASVSAPS